MNGAKRIDAVLLAVCCAAAFALRTLPAWATVFQPDGVVFQGVDAWFHMRVSENLAHAFPARLGRANAAGLNTPPHTSLTPRTASRSWDRL